MTPLDYRCKICQKPGVAYYDPACPITKLDLWKAQLCCDRCYSFRDGFMRCREVVLKLCYLLTVFRTKANQSDSGRKALSDAETAIRSKLTPVTQRIASLCCNYHKLVNVWDVDFVNQLMQKPDKANCALDVYNSELRKIAATPDTRRPHND